MTQIDNRPAPADAAPPKPSLEPNSHVLGAVRAVMTDVIGVAKAGEMRQQTGGKVQYNFQKYDDMAAALGRAFRTHGIATQSLVLDREHYHWEKPTQSGKTLWTWAQVTVRYVFTSLVDGSTFTTEAMGEGTDSSDKATNKAMTSSYKNALKIAFTLATGEDDPDASRPEVNTPHEQARNAPPMQGPPPSQPLADAIWGLLEQVAAQPPEQNSEPSRLQIAQQAANSIPKCQTTGDLSLLAQWASGKGALAAPVDGLPLAARFLGARGTLRPGGPSRAAKQTDPPPDDARASYAPPEPPDHGGY
jgi:hypothetical protein